MSKNFAYTFFWIIVFFLLDPGGFINKELNGFLFGLKYKYTLLIAMYVVFIYVYNQKPISLLGFKYIKYYTISMVLWFSYYIFIFTGINSNEDLGFLGGTSSQFFNILIVYPIIYFSILDIKGFYKVFVSGSIIILLLFMVTILTPLQIIDVYQGDRSFIEATRYILPGGAIILFLLPVFMANFLSKYKLSNKMLIGGILVITYIFLAITRRHIFSIFEYLIIVSLLFKYIYSQTFKSTFIKLFNPKRVIVFLLVIFTVQLIFPSYLNNARKAINETFTVIFNPKLASDHDVARISLTQKAGIIAAITENPFVGTGFAYEWGTGSGGDKEWEGSDYIFLAALAMYGIVGLLIFSPFYVITIKIIIKQMKCLKYSHLKGTLNFNSHNKIHTILTTAITAFFIRYMIEYPNWFFPIGAISTNSQFFIFFGLLVGSYYSKMAAQQFGNFNNYTL